MLLTLGALCLLLGVSTASNLPNDPGLDADALERPHSRALTSILNVLANVDCQTGIGIGNIVSLVGIPLPPQTCICEEEELLEAIEDSKNSTATRTITLCAGKIKTEETIDITGAMFRMTCLTFTARLTACSG